MIYRCDGCRAVYRRRALVKRCLVCAELTCYRCQWAGPAHRHSAMDQASFMADKRQEAALAGRE